MYKHTARLKGNEYQTNIGTSDRTFYETHQIDGQRQAEHNCSNSKSEFQFLDRYNSFKKGMVILSTFQQFLSHSFLFPIFFQLE